MEKEGTNKRTNEQMNESANIHGELVAQHAIKVSPCMHAWNGLVHALIVLYLSLAWIAIDYPLECQWASDTRSLQVDAIGSSLHLVLSCAENIQRRLIQQLINGTDTELRCTRDARFVIFLFLCHVRITITHATYVF